MGMAPGLSEIYPHVFNHSSPEKMKEITFTLLCFLNARLLVLLCMMEAGEQSPETQEEEFGVFHDL
jgi:hypothetical protein